MLKRMLVFHSKSLKKEMLSMMQTPSLSNPLKDTPDFMTKRIWRFTIYMLICSLKLHVWTCIQLITNIRKTLILESRLTKSKVYLKILLFKNDYPKKINYVGIPQR